MAMLACATRLLRPPATTGAPGPGRRPPARSPRPDGPVRHDRGTAAGVRAPGRGSSHWKNDTARVSEACLLHQRRGAGVHADPGARPPPSAPSEAPRPAPGPPGRAARSRRSRRPPRGRCWTAPRTPPGRGRLVMPDTGSVDGCLLGPEQLEVLGEVVSARSAAATSPPGGGRLDDQREGVPGVAVDADGRLHAALGVQEERLLGRPCPGARPATSSSAGRAGRRPASGSSTHRSATRARPPRSAWAPSPEATVARDRVSRYAGATASRPCRRGRSRGCCRGRARSRG